MVTPQLHDTGEEYAIKFGLDDTFTVGLFNINQNQVSDSDDIDAITSEPDGSNYSRQSSSFSAFDSANQFTEEWAVSNDQQMVFDVVGSTTTVNAYFLSATFQSDDKGDGSPQEHLIYTGLMNPQIIPDNGDGENIRTLTINANTIGVKYGTRIDGDVLIEGGDNRIIRNTLNTEYDVTTLNLGQSFFDISFSPQGVEFDSVGGRMYISRINGEIYQYKLREKYDPSTAKFQKKAGLEANKESDDDLRGFLWNNDGTKAFELYDGGGGFGGVSTSNFPDLAIYEYNASEPFEVDTLSSIINSITRSQGSDRLNGMQPGGMCWNDDGTVLTYSDTINPFLTASSNIHQEILSTPYDLSSVENSRTNFNGKGDVAFNYDGTELYQQAGGSLEVFSLSTPFNINSASKVNTVNLQDSGGLGIIFNTSLKYIGDD